MTMKDVEILAPGGSVESIYAGLQYGADAIYTGVDRFSARAFAKNPTVPALCQCLDYAHLHGKKIYLTCNILLHPDEIEEALYERIAPLYEHGLDGVIVQDFGVMKYLHHFFPDLPIHASTQMTVLTHHCDEWMTGYGITRVVPARELSWKDLALFARQTDKELEVFVHGALCYGYSGQCLLSEVIGGRSGNRGMCAGTCRLPYQAENGKELFLLNTKDLCAVHSLEDLIHIGIQSFKIEGRMKGVSYTAMTACYYRKIADQILLGRRMDANDLLDMRRDLADIYNRGGFCEGFLPPGKKESIYYTKKNNHYGVPVGKVKTVKNREFTYETLETIHGQDVLTVRDEMERDLYEYTLKQNTPDIPPHQVVSARYQSEFPLKPGDLVFRRKNAMLLEKFEQEKKLLIPLQMTLKGKIGEPITLYLQAKIEGEAVGKDGEKDVKVMIQKGVGEASLNAPVDPERVRKPLSQLGNTNFFLEKLEVDLEEGMFVPMGALKAMRREGVEKLELELLRLFYRKVPSKDPLETESPLKPYPKTLVTLESGQQAQALKPYENLVPHILLDELSPDDWQIAVDHLENRTFVLSLPQVLSYENRKKILRFKPSLEKIFAEKVEALYIHSLEDLSLWNELGMEGYPRIKGDRLYATNPYATRVYKELGFEYEGSILYGPKAVMLTEGCPLRELKGCQKKKGRTKRRKTFFQTPKKDSFYAINLCDYCYNVIYEDKKEGTPIPGKTGRIDVHGMSVKEMERILNQWNCLL